jgi:LacI family transcriptional regulator
MSKKVRIKDIASRLRLSSTLVSLVLNNKANQHGIKAETQEKVISTAHSMGYFEAVSTSGKSEAVSFNPGIIGLIVTSLKDQFIIELSEHLRKAFASIGFGFSILTLDTDDSRYGRFITSIKRNYSGVVLAGDSVDDHIIRSLKASSFPFLLLEKADVNLRSHEVVSDCEAGAEKLVTHLEGKGYKKFTIIRSSRRSPYIDEKVNCVKEKFLHKLEDAIINECILDIDITNSINDDELIPFLNKPISTDVLIVSEANLVYPIYESLERLKIRIPADIALVSLENGTAYSLLATPVTTLKRDTAGMASKIVSMLWSEIKNNGKSKFKRTVSLAPDLIIGRSCGII